MGEGEANKVYYGRCTDGELGLEALSCSFIRGAQEWSHTFHYQNLLNIAVHYMFNVTLKTINSTLTFSCRQFRGFGGRIIA